MQVRAVMPVTLPTVSLPILSNVCMTFAVFYMRQPLRLDYLWAALSIMGAVYFIFREGTLA